MDIMIAPDNPVRIIDAFIDKLDLKKIGFSNMNPSEEGQPAYHPGDLLTVGRSF